MWVMSVSLSVGDEGFGSSDILRRRVPEGSRPFIEICAKVFIIIVSGEVLIWVCLSLGKLSGLGVTAGAVAAADQVVKGLSGECRAAVVDDTCDSLGRGPSTPGAAGVGDRDLTVRGPSTPGAAGVGGVGGEGWGGAAH